MPQVAVLTLMSVGFAGCSGDMSARFSQNAYSNNPFAFEPRATGSVAAALRLRAPGAERHGCRNMQGRNRLIGLGPSAAEAVSALPIYPAANAGVSGGRGKRRPIRRHAAWQSSGNHRHGPIAFGRCRP